MFGIFVKSCTVANLRLFKKKRRINIGIKKYVLGTNPTG